MGVAGSGKSTVARALAARLGWDLAEGDDLHSDAEVAQLAAGVPLTDTDRAPWLSRIAAWIAAQVAAGSPGIITCSALKRSYRDVLRREQVVFVHLDGTRAQLLARLCTRRGHFMPASLLDSQLADLEPPGADEQAIRILIDASPDAQAGEIIVALG